ncbi:MAG: hypothetical protein U9Q62_08595 [Campylobacterota bacterium]|nr:hypothetical protein [Campylobacterota bacterium]
MTAKSDFFSGMKATSATGRTISIEEMTSGESLLLGKHYANPSKEPVSYNPDLMPNSHVLLLGKSQTGKTTTLKKFIEYMGKPRDIPGYSEPVQKTGFVLDFSGDLGVPGENSILIKGRKSQYGLNLFELFSKDYNSGGVNVQRANIIRMIERYFLGGGMGSVQSSVMEQLISDTYALKGIFDDKEETWDNELPVAEDMLELLILIVDSAETALSVNMLKKIKADGKRIRKLDGHIDVAKDKIDLLEKKGEGDKVAQGKIGKIADQLSKLEDDRNSLYNGLKTLMSDFLDHKIYGEEAGGEIIIEDDKPLNVDIGFYSERNALNALKSLRPHLQKIVESGAFSGQLPPIKRGVNRIDLSLLSLPLQKLFTDLFAQKAFTSVRSRGVYREWPNRVDSFRIDVFFVIDEAKLIIPEGRAAKESKEEPINRIVAESLKFGMCILMASQKISHFSSEMLTNASFKLILQLGPNDMQAAKTMLGLKEGDMRVLQHFGVGLVLDGTKKPVPTVFPWANIPN